MGEDRVNDDSVDAIVESSFVEATQKRVRSQKKTRLSGLSPECTPENAAALLAQAYQFYQDQGILYDTHPFVLLSVKYVFPLLNGIKELIVSPRSETEMMDLLDRGFTSDQVESAKNIFVGFAENKNIRPAVLIESLLGTLDDWFTEDFSPDQPHIVWLGEFLRYLADERNQYYY